MNTVLEATTTVQPEPIRIIRERRWNRATRQYEWFSVTPEMVEVSRRREQYCREFGIYA